MGHVGFGSVAHEGRGGVACDEADDHAGAHVGGGSGGLAIAVTEACPHIKATIVELTKITPVTQHYIDEAGAGDRVKVVTADAVRDPLFGSYDVAVMSAFLQVLSPDDARFAAVCVDDVKGAIATDTP